MVETVISKAGDFFASVFHTVPPGLIICGLFAFIEGRKYIGDFRHEFVGTLIMICCTFSAGKWVGSNSTPIAWLSHAIGVVTADKVAGGPHVNPAVTMSMFCLGKCGYTEGLVRIAAQIGGGLVAFPLYHNISEFLKLTPFGGPEFDVPSDKDHATEAFLSEFTATICLMFAIYILNWELNFGTYHYWIKQTLTAVAIRALIELFPTAGPAMNPMLATTWAVFGVGDTFEFPGGFQHYFVYWIAPFLGAIVASVLYVVYAGGTVFGKSLPVGPFKKPKATISKKKKN